MTDDKLLGLLNAWENFKQVNDSRLKEINRKGHADPLYDEHLSAINATLDNHKHRLSRSDVQGSPSGYVQGERTGDCQYGKAFRNYLRRGMDAGLEVSQQMSAGSEDDGGYRVTSRMSSMIMRAVYESSPMRQIASIETISSDSLDLIDDHASTVAGWTIQSDGTTETGTQPLAKRHIPTHELYAQPKATQRLVDDAALDVEAWLSERIADIFARTQNTAFISGNGVGQPRGILTYAAGTAWGQIQQINSGVSGQVTADGLINLYYALKDKHSRKANFLMNRTTVQNVRLLKQATTNQYLWQPGLAAGAPDTLLGVPVFTTSDMPEPGHSSLSVAVADFKEAYQIVDRADVRILRDPFTEKPFVKFYATARVGGDVVDSEAIKLLRLAV